MEIGVLALQGDFLEHRQMLEHMGVAAPLVRTEKMLGEIDGLIIPGGESTTIGMLLVKYSMLHTLKSRIERGMPVFGTCAGTILLAEDIEGRARLGSRLQPSLGVMDITVQRNAYGRQIDSFETTLPFPGSEGSSLRALFIRAPQITRVGPEVKVLASLPDGKPVAVKNGNKLAVTFHPELTEDTQVHRYFVRMVEKSRQNCAIAV
ncbi:MAG: pyridoxal 5'-phosphate synthase glutaminase subunit PdxT [Candidatus Xenobiia bacterium LiM19]